MARSRRWSGGGRKSGSSTRRPASSSPIAVAVPRRTIRGPRDRNLLGSRESIRCRRWPAWPPYRLRLVARPSAHGSRSRNGDWARVSSRCLGLIADGRQARKDQDPRHLQAGEPLRVQLPRGRRAEVGELPHARGGQAREVGAYDGHRPRRVRGALARNAARVCAGVGRALPGPRPARVPREHARGISARTRAVRCCATSPSEHS